MTNSPAINAGASEGAPPIDQRGVTRPRGDGVDIGAFELENLPPPTAPQITAQPAGLTAIVRDTLSLSLIAWAFPLPRYQWLREGEPVPSATRPTLTLTNVQSAQAGVYTVIVSNTLGSVTSAPALLIVKLTNFPPTIVITQPTNGAIFGTTATIPIRATASDEDGSVARVEFFTGTSLIGTVSTPPFSFSLQNQSAGARLLTARATDDRGAIRVSDPVSFYVGDLPKITAGPQSRTVTNGSTVTLSVTASGTPTLFYQWWKNGSTLSGATNTSLVLLNFQPADAGAYMVQVTNLYGSASASAALTMQATNSPPAVRIVAPKNGTAFAFPATFQITALASDSDGTISRVSFLRDSLLLGSVANSPYTFLVQGWAEGQYVLNAQAQDNRGATGISVPVTVLIGDAPKITEQPMDQSVLTGTTAVLLVSATGSTPLAYQWLKGSSPVAGATNCSLTLTQTQTAQTGPYRVIVTNLFGATTSVVATISLRTNFLLTVQTTGGGTVFEEPPGSLFPPGSVVMLTAAAGSESAFTGWSGDAAGESNPIMVLMDRDRTILGHFLPRPWIKFRRVSQGFLLSLTGGVADRYRLERSQSLGVWSTVVTLTNVTGTVPYLVRFDLNSDGAFYRAVLLP